MRKCEVLAPAGDLEKLKWVLMYGADAVYIGGENYSLRANANNFTVSEIKEAVKFAHKLKKKVYITVNMLFHNEDLSELDKYLIKLSKIGVDAFIVSDLSVIKRIRKLKLKPEIHISTQESTTNYETVNFWKSLGATRVVLARECSKEDIKDILDKTSVELEVFIHGAMCTSYSGRCVLSNYVTYRDSNRGGCSQVCRFSFDIENIDKEFAISSKDLNMAKYIGELVDLGVSSLKIEGRMRSIYYIATVANAYKNIIDKKISNKLDEETIKYYTKVLTRCANRESCPQFYDKMPGANEQYYTGREEISNQDFLGIVLKYDKKNKIAYVEQRNNFKIGQTIEVFSPNKKPFTFKVNEIYNKDGFLVDVARHPQEKLKIKLHEEVEKYDILRVPIDLTNE